MTAAVWQRSTQPDGWILRDPEWLPELDGGLFRAGEHAGAQVLGHAEDGRGSAVFLRSAQGDLVLRHYQRGGPLARWNSDQYLWLGRDQSRPAREFVLLQAARAQGLPVPRPVAAAVWRQGLFYRGDLLMQALPDARSLQQWLIDGDPRLDWAALARTLAALHRAGFWHADLNARNILWSEEQWWVIDWDRGQRRRAGGGWGLRNLARLRRSLDKAQKQGVLQYQDADWAAFIDRYQAARETGAQQSK